MRIRAMGQQDIVEAAALEALCFSEPWTVKNFEETLQLNYAYYFIALNKEGNMIGCAGLRNIAGEGEISNVVVSPLFRRQKVAEGLLKQLLKQGESLGITEYTLEVRASNEAAISLYKKLGFKPEGNRKNFYHGPIEDALIMWKR